jgi:regulatory protein
MDREAHVENSSSQNVNQDVYGRIERGASRNGLQAVSTEGSSFFIPKSCAEAFNLAVGQQLNQQDFNALKAEAERIIVLQKAVDLLSRREHSTQELRLKLKKRDYDQSVIEQVISTLRDKGYLDDVRFAAMWIRSRLRKKPESPFALKAGLMNKGVDADTAETAIREAEVDWQDVLETAVKKKLDKTADPKKVLAYLVRRGFSYPEVMKALKRIE